MGGARSMNGEDVKFEQQLRPLRRPKIMLNCIIGKSDKTCAMNTSTILKNKNRCHLLCVSGRRKKNRFGLLMLGGLFKGGMFALGLNGLGLLAGKALLVAKIALVLSAVVGLSSLLSSGHKEEKTTYEIVEDPHVSHAYTYSSGHIDGGHGHFDSGDQGHYRKSLKIPGAAMLAYRGQRQGQNP